MLCPLLTEGKLTFVQVKSGPCVRSDYCRSVSAIMRIYHTSNRQPIEKVSKWRKTTIIESPSLLLIYLLSVSSLWHTISIGYPSSLFSHIHLKHGFYSSLRSIKMSFAGIKYQLTESPPTVVFPRLQPLPSVSVKLTSKVRFRFFVLFLGAFHRTFDLAFISHWCNCFEGVRTCVL